MHISGWFGHPGLVDGSLWVDGVFCRVVLVLCYGFDIVVSGDCSQQRGKPQLQSLEISIHSSSRCLTMSIQVSSAREYLLTTPSSDVRY